MKNIFTTFTVLFLATFGYAQNNALTLNGTNQYLYVSRVDPLPMKAITIETWVKFRNPGSGDATNPQNDWIWESRVDGNIPNSDVFWFWFSNANTFNLGYRKMALGFSGARSATGGPDFLFDFNPTPNQWYHIAATYNGDTREMKFYVNGDLQGTQINTGTQYPKDLVSSNDIHVGNRLSNVLSSTLDGELDEYRIWSSVRTATQIKDNYNKQVDGNSPNLEMYFKFDQPTITRIYGSCSKTAETARMVFPTYNNIVPSTTSTVNTVACNIPTPNVDCEYISSVRDSFSTGDWVRPQSWSCGKVPSQNDAVLIRYSGPYILADVTLRSLYLDGGLGYITGYYNSSTNGGFTPVNNGKKLVIKDEFQWTNGILEANIETLGKTTIKGSSYKRAYYFPTWTNKGDAEIEGGLLSFSYVTIRNEGTMRFTNGAKIARDSFYFDEYNTFINCGTLSVQGNTILDMNYQSCGTASKSMITGSGALKFANTINTSDVIKPQGSFTLNPSVSATAEATFELTLKGDKADKLLSDGNITLNGTLRLILSDLKDGSFAIVSGNSVSGNFSKIEYSTNGGALSD